MNISIAYVTSRKEPQIKWFFDSLALQAKLRDRIQIIVVGPDDFRLRERKQFQGLFRGFNVRFSEPKPSVWQGPHRLTKEDWFAASNARNTALCLAPDGYLAYVDDLSVLQPGWLDAVKEHAVAGRFGFGAYHKVKHLVVENGMVKSFENYRLDNRWNETQSIITPCSGRWLFGCSVCGPVEAFLTVGGWPEFCDGLGFEDCILGHALENHGFPMVYDKRMMTFESEEHHAIEPAFKRSDFGVSPNDKSHSALHIGQQSRYFENYYLGGIRKMREEVLAGKPFPIVNNPQHCWYSGKKLSDL